MYFYAILFSLIAVAAQFINEPTAFNPADTYVAPQGTSVVSFSTQNDFGEATIVSSPSSLSNFPVVSAPTTSAYLSGSTTTIMASVVAPVPDVVPTPASTTSLSTTNSAASKVDFGPASVTSPAIPSNVPVVTVDETFYTTVPCTTTSITGAPPAISTSIVQSSESATPSSENTQSSPVSHSSSLQSSSLQYSSPQSSKSTQLSESCVHIVTEVTTEYVTQTRDRTVTVTKWSVVTQTA